MGVQIWVEFIDGIVMTRMKGTPTEEINRQLQSRILQCIGTRGKVLYDIREVLDPPIEAPMSQWKIESESGPVYWKRAIVVPNTRLAYLAGLAFADQRYRIFYNDLEGAIQWLNEESVEARS